MSEMTKESIDELLARIEALEKEIKEMHARAVGILVGGTPTVPTLRVRVPDENTPINTIIRFDGIGLNYFWRGKNRVSKSPFDTGITDSAIKSVTVDALADLQFRLFLNAPKEYRWGAIDEDGEGYVYINKPALGEEWWSKIEDALSVGLFPQYVDEWNKILVEREETK